MTRAYRPCIATYINANSLWPLKFLRNMEVPELLSQQLSLQLKNSPELTLPSVSWRTCMYLQFLYGSINFLEHTCQYRRQQVWFKRTQSQVSPRTRHRKIGLLLFIRTRVRFRCLCTTSMCHFTDELGTKVTSGKDGRWIQIERLQNVGGKFAQIRFEG